MFFSSSQDITREWYISHKVNMEAGTNVGWVHVPSSALIPAQAAELWQVYDDGVKSGAEGWHDAPKLRVRVMSAKQHQAELHRLEEEQIQAMAQAQEAKSIMVEGQEEGDYQHGRMGMYELVEGKGVNGRGVWQLQGNSDSFLYFSRSNVMEWVISNRREMEAGEAVGWTRVTSRALTPDRVTKLWRLYDGVKSGAKGWHDAPKLRVRVMLAEQHQAEYARIAARYAYEAAAVAAAYDAAVAADHVANDALYAAGDAAGIVPGAIVRVKECFKSEVRKGFKKEIPAPTGKVIPGGKQDRNDGKCRVRYSKKVVWRHYPYQVELAVELAGGGGGGDAGAVGAASAVGAAGAAPGGAADPGAGAGAAGETTPRRRVPKRPVGK
jgi:hypothetical protein